MEENKNISQIALEKIKESGIKPISRTVFSIKRVIVWSLMGLFIILGFISFSVMLSILFKNDWYLYSKLGLSFIFKTLPYFWIVFLLLFIFLGEYIYRKTSLGYRYNIFLILGVFVILAIIFGSMLHILGVGEKVEESFSSNIPMYHGVMFDKDKFWNNAKDGFISGKIISVNGYILQIVDFDNKVWFLDFSKSIIKNKVELIEGKVIKIIGDIKNDGVFIPEEIRPWNGKKMR